MEIAHTFYTGSMLTYQRGYIVFIGITLKMLSSNMFGWEIFV